MLRSPTRGRTGSPLIDQLDLHDLGHFPGYDLLKVYLPSATGSLYIPSNMTSLVYLSLSKVRSARRQRLC